MDTYLFLKALHIIGFVSWFAGLFYMVRLFVYHREAWDKTDPEGRILRNQYQLMEGRLMNIIQTPAMLITLTGGIGMLLIRPEWLSSPWMHLKLALVALLVLYHFTNIRQMRQLRQGPTQMSSFEFRLYNELPTLLLIAIVMLAVWKSLTGLGLGVALLLGLGLIFFAVARFYKRRREKQQ